MQHAGSSRLCTSIWNALELPVAGACLCYGKNADQASVRASLRNIAMLSLRSENEMRVLPGSLALSELSPHQHRLSVSSCWTVATLIEGDSAQPIGSTRARRSFIANACEARDARSLAIAIIKSELVEGANDVSATARPDIQLSSSAIKQHYSMSSSVRTGYKQCRSITVVFAVDHLGQLTRSSRHGFRNPLSLNRPPF